MGKYVVLLHGLGRTNTAMEKMERFLSESGFIVYNLHYPSTKHKINKLADLVYKMLEEKKLTEVKELNFVTHSLGGIILRVIAEKHHLRNWGHVVMLAPPNKGSQVVDYMRKTPLLYWVLGPAALELGTDSQGIAQKLPQRVDFSLGVIAGTSSINRIFSRFFLKGKKNDGKVTVENTKIEGMKDFITVEENHTFIMNSSKVQKHVFSFLKTGHFASESNKH
ncbi:hypothetical protein PRVXH_002333 [Proteinivorax hydrogeniformans]|uniref:Uncharacterized protein n=1 Tax=Proteinivorax hydrogeniformans TaxID=1826727 RepID=A0AAU8HSM6_9FIRM